MPADNLGVQTGSDATIRTKETAGVHLNVSAISDTTGANIAAVSAAGRVSVDASGVTVPTQEASSLVDNAGFTDGTSRVIPAGFVFDETAGTALTENDAAAARIDAKRAQVAVIEDGTTRGLRATVRDLASNDALNVAIVDGSGNQVTSFGGGTQYAEDSAHASGDQVTMAGVVQQSADTALSNDGDRSVLQVDANGYLKVNIKAGAGSGGTSATDDAAFTIGAGSGTPIMGLADTDNVDTGDVGVLRMTVARALHAHLVNTAGLSVTITSTVPTDTAVGLTTRSVPSFISSTDTLTSLDDTAVVPSVGAAGWAATGVQVTGTWTATLSFEAQIDGSTWVAIDAIPLVGTTAVTTTTANGAWIINTAGVRNIRVRASSYTSGTATVTFVVCENGSAKSAGGGGSVDTELPAAAALADNTANPTVPAVGAFGMLWDGATWDRAAGTSTDGQLVNLGSNNDVHGLQARDAALSGNNPVLAGARASSAIPAAVSTDGDVVDLWADLNGALFTRQRPASASGLTNVASSITSVTLLAANNNRIEAFIMNDSTSALWVKLGATASNTSYTKRLAPGEFWPVPQSYRGIIDGIWQSAQGNARMTELTA